MTPFTTVPTVHTGSNGGNCLQRQFDFPFFSICKKKAVWTVETFNTTVSTAPTARKCSNVGGLTQYNTLSTFPTFLTTAVTVKTSRILPNVFDVFFNNVKHAKFKPTFSNISTFSTAQWVQRLKYFQQLQCFQRPQYSHSPYISNGFDVQFPFSFKDPSDANISNV